MWNTKGSSGNYSAFEIPVILWCCLLGWLSLAGTGLKNAFQCTCSRKSVCRTWQPAVSQTLVLQTPALPLKCTRFYRPTLKWCFPLHLTLSFYCPGKQLQLCLVFCGLSKVLGNPRKNATKILNNMKKSRSQMNTSKVFLKETFSHGWGQRGERRCLGACIVALYVLQWEIKFTRTVGRVETVKPQATLVYAAEPQHPRDQNLGHSLVVPYNMTKWPLRSTTSDQKARREEFGYPNASGTGLQILSIKGIWNLKQSPKRRKEGWEGNIQTPSVPSRTHFHLFFPVTS